VERLIACVASAILRLVRRLPEGVSLAIGAAAGHVGYYLLHRRRRIALRNLAIAFGREKGPRERRRIARAAFRNAGLVAVDLARLPLLTLERARAKIRIDGLDRIAAVRERGLGVLALSAHLGSFELIAAGINRLGLLRCSLVGKRVRNERLDRIVVSLRETCGVASIPPEGAIREVLRRVRRNEAVGFVLDQNFRHGVFVNFFGVPARTAQGLAFLARRSGAPVVPFFAVRDARDWRRHTIHVGPEIPYERGATDEEEALLNTQRYTSAIEAFVRRFPEQWFWAHDRFRSRPREEAGIPPVPARRPPDPPP